MSREQQHLLGASRNVLGAGPVSTSQSQCLGGQLQSLGASWDVLGAGAMSRGQSQCLGCSCNV